MGKLASGCSSSEVKSSYEKQTFYMLGMINDETEKCFYTFAKESLEPELEKIEEKREKIKIHIASPGGYTCEALSIVGLIEYYKEKGLIIETYIRSLAASAATLVSSSGTKGHRYCNRYSEILIHQPSGGVYGDLKAMETVSTNNAHVWSVMKEIYQKNSRITEKKLEEIYQGRNDWYLTPDEAKGLQFVDHIL